MLVSKTKTNIQKKKDKKIKKRQKQKEKPAKKQNLVSLLIKNFVDINE